MSSMCDKLVIGSLQSGTWLFGVAGCVAPSLLDGLQIPDDAEENRPDPQEIMTLVKVSDNRVALKTAFGRSLLASYIKPSAGFSPRRHLSLASIASKSRAMPRYITSVVDSEDVDAKTEAMGVRELWQPIDQGEGIWAFRSPDKRYLCAATPGMPVTAGATSASSTHMPTFRRPLVYFMLSRSAPGHYHTVALPSSNRGQPSGR